MSERNEAERLDYVLGSPVFDWAGPEVVRFEAHEALSKLFHVDITLRSMGGPIAADELISSPATLRIRTAEGYRSVHGLIAEVDELDRTALASFVRVRLVPAWYRATQRVRSRTFVDQTLGEIIVHVLENRSSESPQGDGGLQAGATLEGELEWESSENWVFFFVNLEQDPESLLHRGGTVFQIFYVLCDLRRAVLRIKRFQEKLTDFSGSKTRHIKKLRQFARFRERTECRRGWFRARQLFQARAHSNG
mgnify:CR=1 FL=1